MQFPGKIRHFPWLESLTFFCGILIFTYFITGECFSVFLASIGVVLSLGVVVVRLRSGASLFQIFGFERIQKHCLYFILVSLLAGFILGMLYRGSLKLGVLPRQLVSFALLAALIGATEELLFRGFIQTSLRKVNIYLGIIFGAIAHTVYKLILFWSLESGFQIDITGLIIWTMFGGLVFGILRETSKSVLFPILSHIVFDIIVYGDRTIPPWWIWG